MQVEALHKALDQHVHQLKQRQAELEQQQGREGALLDELASWKDAACKVLGEASPTAACTAACAPGQQCRTVPCMACHLVTGVWLALGLWG